MIHTDEVIQCIQSDPASSNEYVDLSVEYFRMGGFHPRVDQHQRDKFRNWLEARDAAAEEQDYAPPHENQLSLFDELECAL